MKVGLVLSSGAARGWAHVGVMRGLEEIGVKPDLICGASVGALVGGAHLLGQTDALMAWASALSPMNAFKHFDVMLSRGGLVRAEKAFETFRTADKMIEDLETPFAAAAVDLATGEEVWLRAGSVINAAQASSAIPVLFHAVEIDGRWLVDGALANPLPVNLAREMGADIVIASDLMGHPRVLERFEPRPPGPPALIPDKDYSADGRFPALVSQFLNETRDYVSQQIEFAKARARATPGLFETAMATADIFQTHLTKARLKAEPADIHLTPHVPDALPTAMDKGDEFVEEGYRCVMAAREEIEKALK